MKNLRRFTRSNGEEIIINMDFVTEVMKSQDEGFINICLSLINEGEQEFYEVKGTLDSFRKNEEQKTTIPQ